MFESRMRLSIVGLVLAAILPLGGCESLGLSTPDPETVVDIGPPCPATAVLSDAVSVTKLRPGATGLGNPADIAYSAEMSQARLDCDYDENANRLTIDLNFQVRATRGPAAPGQAGDPQLDFFVAVVDLDDNVVAKTVYHGQAILGGRPTNTYTQSVNNFTVTLMMDRRPADYQLLTGFQLTPDELAYNRTPRAVPAVRPAMP